MLPKKSFHLVIGQPGRLARGQQDHGGGKDKREDEGEDHVDYVLHSATTMPSRVSFSLAAVRRNELLSRSGSAAIQLSTAFTTSSGT